MAFSKQSVNFHFKVVWSSPHRIFVFSVGRCIVYHKESLCFPEHGVTLLHRVLVFPWDRNLMLCDGVAARIFRVVHCFLESVVYATT